jgi:hypothetical protein
MEVTLQSTGSARRWAKNTIQQHVTKSKRGGNTDYSLGNKKSGEGGGMGRNAAGPCSPLHGPGSTITGTLPRRRRRHTTGASTARRDGDNNSSRSGAALGPASSGPAFESDTQGEHSPGGPEYHVTGPVRPLPVAPVGPYVCALYGDFSYLVFRRAKNLGALPGT